MLNNWANCQYQRGFSLLEVLIATLLFAVSLLGLLQYHQVLLQAFQRQWQYQQAWLLAHHQLEMFNVSTTVSDCPLVSLPNWQCTVETHMAQIPCLRRVVKIQTPLRQQVVLSRWYCNQ